MYLEESNKVKNNKKILLNNLNDFIIQIDYYDQKGIKKRKNKIPLKYILNTKFIHSRIAIYKQLSIYYLVRSKFH